MGKPFTPGLAYDVLTPFYDALSAVTGFGDTFMRRVAAALPLTGDEALLDVGCGTGTLLAALAARHPGLRLAGIDADRRMLSRAAGKLRGKRHIRLVQAFAQDLPFHAGAFDVIVSTLIFHHLSTDTKRAAIRDVGRVLKPGGRFLLADFGRPQTVTQRVLLYLGSLFDGRENTRANLAGTMPDLLAEGGFHVTEAGPRYRAVQFLHGVKGQALT